MKPEAVVGEYHEGIVTVAVVTPYKRAPTTNIYHPVVIERGRPAIAMILVKLECSAAAIALPRLGAVIASFRAVNGTIPHNHPHPAIAVDKCCAAKVIERAVLDENCLFTAPVRIVSP